MHNIYITTIYISFTEKRVFTPHQTNSERRTHDQTLEWANKIEEGEYTIKNGIYGKSPFFGVDGFDVVYDMLPEPMHLLDAGFMKNTMGRTFNSGTAPQCRPGYKRTNTKRLSKLIE